MRDKALFKKYFSIFNIIFAITLPVTVYSGQIANVEYIHNKIKNSHNIDVPINPLASPTQIANVEYLLCAVDKANEALNGEKTTDYCHQSGAIPQVVDTVAVNTAISEKIKLNVPANADSVILMIGDGMGINHINCSGGYISTLSTSAWVSTYPANGPSYITDSAAGATAYACGLKTNNQYIAMTPGGQICETVAEKTSAKGYQTVIATDDIISGATPAAFYAHTLNRSNTTEILSWLAINSPPMVVEGSLSSPSAYTSYLINQYDTNGGANGRINGKPFFWMIEEALIDKSSHSNDYPGMLTHMSDFNDAVQVAVNFVNLHPEVTLIVTADHETGGLNTGCVYTSTNHTGANVPLYSFGKHSSIFSGTMQNSDVGIQIQQIIFPN